MTTTTAEAGPSAAKLPPAKGRAGIGGAIRSEWTKIRTVRSTYWTMLAFIVVGVGLEAAVCAATASQWSHMRPGEHFAFNPASLSVRVFAFVGPLILMVLGALAITSEYSTGMIRTSLTAQPRRGTVAAAKLVVFTAVAAVLSAVTALASFFLAQQILASTGRTAALSDPNVPRILVGAILYVTVLGVMAYAIGLILRHTAAAIATMAGILFVLPLVTALLPTDWSNDVVRWLPDSASTALLSTEGQLPHLFAAWPQFGVTAGYTVALLIVGAILLHERDA